MAFRGHITKKQQEEWYQRILIKNEHYFIIAIDGREVGLTELKNFSVDGQKAEAGIFIADSKFQDSVYAYAVSSLLLDFGFDVLGLQEIEAGIMDDNPRAIRFNKSLGFVRADEDPVDGKSRYLLRAEHYRERIRPLRNALARSLAPAAT
jgi:UDP-4-amino-4,6-dideoxy-N-acetyl-beta-L-altrosamine N-acetyltransferase